MKILLALAVISSLLYIAVGSCLTCLPSQATRTISTSEYIADIAYDPEGNKVYVAYWNNDVVDIFNRDGTKHGTIDLEFDTWGSLTSIDIHQGVLYGSMQNRHYIRSANLHTKETSVLFGPFTGFGYNNIIVKGNQVYVVNYVDNAVILYDSSGQEVKRFTTSDLRYPQDAAFDSKGNLHVVGTYNFTVYVFDASGNVVSTYGKCFFKEPFGIFIDSLDNSYIADRLGQSILMFDENRDFVHQILAPLKAVNEVVLLPDCELWVSAAANKTILVYG